MRDKLMRAKILVPMTAFTIAGAALTAQADVMIGDTIDLTFQDVDPGRAVDWSFRNNDGTSRAGFFNWVGGIQTFCIQIMEDIADNEAISYGVVSLENVPDRPPRPNAIGVERATVIRDLYSRYYDLVRSKSGATAKNYAAAFQITIWEISHEENADGDAASIVGDLDLSRGKAEFEASNAVMNIAETMLASLGDGGFLSSFTLLGLTHMHYQDQIMVVENATVVPGIGSLAVLGGIGAVRRRRRR